MNNQNQAPAKPITLSIFTDKNLVKVLAQGWSEERLLKGQIATLTGRKFQIQVPNLDVTIYDVKSKIEDQEGFEIEKQELRRGNKNVLKNEKTLKECKVNSDITLLLCYNDDSFDPFKIHPSNKNQKQQNKKEQEGNKLKTPPIITQTLTITADEEQKYANKNNQWWQNNGMSSGPKTPNKKSSAGGTTPVSSGTTIAQQQSIFDSNISAEPLSAPTVLMNDPFAASGGRRLNENSSEPPQADDAAARREHMRKIAEERLKRLGPK